jgi:transcription initiation factor TFIID TATA-box-binding protein
MNIVESPGIPNCTIVNVVATYNIGVRLNLKKLALCKRTSPVKFNPARFAAMTINVEAPGLEKTTALCFASGNFVHTGATTEEHSRLAAHTLIRYFNEELDIPASLNNFTITNIVCDFKTGFEVNLYELARDRGARAKYEPENFPACRIVSQEDENQVALVYLSGGCVLTGLKNRAQIRRIHRETFNVCSRHKDNPRGGLSRGEFRKIGVRKQSVKRALAKTNKTLKKMLVGEKIKKSDYSAFEDGDKHGTKPYTRSINPCTPILRGTNLLEYHPTSQY